VTGRLEDKVALITGTGSGMGRAAALRFAAEGALVVGCDINATGNAETVDAVKAAGGRMDGMAPVDLGDPDEAHRWVQDAAALHGRIDILYNNASACKFAMIEQMTVEDWYFTTRNELDLVFFVTKAAWSHLCVNGGVIINTASVAGHGGGAGGIGHGTTKAGVLSMTKTMAAEGSAHGIRAVSISPGVILTPGSAEQLALPGALDALLSRSLVKRVGTVEEIAGVAAFLASDEASFITGADYLVDGGLTNA
jgi:meso-butanediol dehydrogenase/(S,S)-butanediol dehydrogenase/diacetyl reductase